MVSLKDRPKKKNICRNQLCKTKFLLVVEVVDVDEVEVVLVVDVLLVVVEVVDVDEVEVVLVVEVLLVVVDVVVAVVDVVLVEVVVVLKSVSMKTTEVR